MLGPTHRALIALVIGFVVIMSQRAPLDAVVNGTADGDRHTNVGSLCLKVTTGAPWNCFPAAATLVSRRVMVTVAHGGPFITGINPAVIAISFEAAHSAEPGDFFGSARPISEPTHIVAEYHTHPDWNPNDLVDPLDIGVFVLEEPVRGIEKASIAPEGFLDGVWEKQNDKHREFTAVGYGVVEVMEPLFDGWNVRRVATTTGTALNSGSILTAAIGPGQGVGCYGESGSPLFYKKTPLIVGVGSYVMGLCEEFGYSRVDTAAARAFLLPFIETDKDAEGSMVSR